MILFTTTPERWGDHGRGIGPIANRWAAFLRRAPGGFCLGVDRQYLSTDDLHWHGACGDYYQARVSWPWVWGAHHFYYDGPHCNLSLGFLHFDWSGDWCERCHSGE